MIAIQRSQAVAHGGYLPTPADIQRACEEIQATWSRSMRALRAAERRAAWWTLPTVTLTDVLQAAQDEQTDGWR